MFQPLNGFVVGTVIPDTTVVGSIIIPAAAKSAALRRGHIVAVAPDVTTAKAGQIAYFPGPEANVIIYEGQEYFIIQVQGLLGVSDADAEKDKPNTTPELLVPDTARNRKKAAGENKILVQ